MNRYVLLMLLLFTARIPLAIAAEDHTVGSALWDEKIKGKSHDTILGDTQVITLGREDQRQEP